MAFHCSTATACNTAILFVRKELEFNQIHRFSLKCVGDKTVLYGKRLRQTVTHFNTLRTGDGDLRFYITTVQDG